MTILRTGTIMKDEESGEERSTIDLKELEANMNLYELIDKIDKNIDYKKNHPGKIQTEALSAYKIKQAAKKLYKLLYRPVEEEKVLKPGETLLPMSPR